MRISIFGSGYVGLVSGVCFAQMGNHVVCVDVDEQRVAQLKQAKSPIYEPGLGSLLLDNIEAGRIEFTTDAKMAVEYAEIIFIAVGTPPEEDGSADLQYVLQVAKTIGQHLNAYKVVVNKSTVPVGTADKVKAALSKVLMQRGFDCPFDVVSNPEFLKEGAAIDDCMRPDRIVVGTSSEKAAEVMKQLYAPFNRNHDKLMIMDERSSEMTKYAANAMLATKISFMNEMSRIAERVGADIEHVRLGIGADPRIGYSFIYPGCGYGGSCFPKDVQALRHIAGTMQYQAKILDAVHHVNEQQKQVLFEKIMAHYDGDLEGKTFAVWGIAFKPNTDDIREAPSRVAIEALWAKGAKVKAYDPEAQEAFDCVYASKYKECYQLCDTPEECLLGSNGLIIFTEWLPFRSPDFGQMSSCLEDRVIFDGRNLYEPNYVEQHRLVYYTIGRPRPGNG